MKTKTMNNKTAINTYLSTIEFRKTNEANKTKRDRIMDTESIWMVARWEGCEGMGEEVRGLRSTNR